VTQGAVLLVYGRTGKEIGFAGGHRNGEMFCFSICASNAIFASFFSNGIGGSAVPIGAIPAEK
jgi:hypothetical protein